MKGGEKDGFKRKHKIRTSCIYFRYGEKADQREVDILTGYAMACANEQDKKEAIAKLKKGEKGA